MVMRSRDAHLFVFIGNNEYEMESFNVGARSCLNAGKLSLLHNQSHGAAGSDQARVACSVWRSQERERVSGAVRAGDLDCDEASSSASGVGWRGHTHEASTHCRRHRSHCG